MKRPIILALTAFTLACGGGSGDGDASIDGDVPADAAVMDGAVDAVADAQRDGAGPDAGEPDAAEPDAGPEPCSTTGEMRAVECGSCGLAQEVCEAGLWVRGTCMAEGVCAPGALDGESLPDCTSRSRICTMTCAWTDWGSSGEAGECLVDDTRVVDGTCGFGETQSQVCNASCAWEDEGVCESVCGELRTTPFDAAEVCIPGGEFVRGVEGRPETTPVALVHVSTFALGTYPITTRRFLTCRAAGACAAPLSDLAEALLLDVDVLDHPVRGVGYGLAQEFCGWDVGGRLPTEAEFEKAVRGPAPRENIYPWDGDAYRCDLLAARGCAGVPAEFPDSDPVTAFPGARSFYGAQGMFGFGKQWVSDWWDPDYYGDPTSLTDPQGPDAPPFAGGPRSARGTGRRGAMSEQIYLRHGGPVSTTAGIPFRCARDIPVEL